MEFLIPLLGIAVIILINALFVAAEFAIVGIPPTRLVKRAESGSRPAQRLLATIRNNDRMARYIATAQIGNSLSSLALGMYGEHTLANWLIYPLRNLGNLAEPAAHTISIILAIGLLTYIHVVFGEMIPKSLALLSAESTALKLERPMAWMQLLFLPTVYILNATGKGLMRLLGVPPADPHSRLMTPEELEYLVDESHAGGLIESDEQLFIENILDLSERTIDQVMTHRTHIVAIPIDMPLDKILALICETRYSRYPVFSNDLDQVIGILHTKTLARHRIQDQEPFDLEKMIRPAIHVPESLSLEAMLARFRKDALQMAIVVDEYGGVAGLVTIEDVVEEVVGEIQDEFSQEIPPLEEIAPDRLRVRGDLLLGELNQHYDLDLLHPDADTIAGYLMATLGRMLKPGDQLETRGIRMEVESVQGRAVQTVILHLPNNKLGSSSSTPVE